MTALDNHPAQATLHTNNPVKKPCRSFPSIPYCSCFSLKHPNILTKLVLALFYLYEAPVTAPDKDPKQATLYLRIFKDIVVTFLPFLAAAFSFEAPKRPHQACAGPALPVRGSGHRSGQRPRAGDALRAQAEVPRTELSDLCWRHGGRHQCGKQTTLYADCLLSRLLCKQTAL